jgi:hypothetical protein
VTIVHATKQRVNLWTTSDVFSDSDAAVILPPLPDVGELYRERRPVEERVRERLFPRGRKVQDQALLCAVAELLGWNPNAPQAGKYPWRWQAKWKHLRGNASILPSTKTDHYMVCVRTESGKIRHLEFARAFGMSRGMKYWMGPSALRLLNKRLRYLLGEPAPKLPRFRVPRAEYRATLRRAWLRRLAHLHGFRQQYAWQNKEYRWFPFTPDWARAMCDFPDAGISDSQLQRDMDLFVKAGLLRVKGKTHKRKYTLAPVKVGETGCTLKQLKVWILERHADITDIN